MTNISKSIFKKCIAKKPRLTPCGYYNGEEVYDGWVCPNCYKFYDIFTEQFNYCPTCGQRIDWSEVEENAYRDR